MGEKGNKLVGSTEAASWLRLGPQRVRELTHEGILTSVSNGNRSRYDLKTIVGEYIEYLRARAEKQRMTESAAEADLRKRVAEADYKRHKADMAEMELKELEVKMHRTEDVEALTNELIYAVRSTLLALPSRLAMDVANASTSSECAQIIKREVYNALNELAEYQFNPEKFKKLVRERAGWDKLKTEDDGEDDE